MLEGNIFLCFFLDYDSLVLIMDMGQSLINQGNLSITSFYTTAGTGLVAKHYSFKHSLQSYIQTCCYFKIR